jgi:TolB-like protein/DNA-binding winged helix-turn-helix (wHTH) protein
VGADLVPIGDGLTLDLSRGCLVRGQEPLHLRPQSYEVLKFLAERPGQLVSKDTLVAHVWEGRAVGDGSLGKCVEEIREALGPAARERLRTVWGRGYILEPVAAPSAITAAALSGEPSGQPKPPPRDRKFTPRSYLPAAAALVLVLAFGVWRYTTARDEPLNAIAVLPFVNASGTPDLEYLSDGISEKLIDRLSRISGLRVIAWSSSLRYKDANADPLTVSSSLGVAAIVTGQVAVRGKTLQVTTELGELASGASGTAATCRMRSRSRTRYPSKSLNGCTCG